jgi:GTP cyclohydrolase II
MILMSLTAKPAGLDGYGLKIVGRVPVPTTMES